jgi:hypothetical protein
MRFGKLIVENGIANLTHKKYNNVIQYRIRRNTRMKKLLTFISALVLSLCTFAVARAADESFIHPGLLHTQEDLDRISEAVANGEQPYLDGWNKLIESQYAQPGAEPRAVETAIRGGNGDNISILYTDIARSYQCALRWKIEGNEECGETACNILNAWSETLKTVSGNADRYLASGLYGYELANAAELMRDYPGFEVERMQNMLIDVFYKPLCERFLISNEFGADHNDAYITNYWANWDLANMAATVAIGVFCDRKDIYDIGIEYFKNGKGNGSIYNAIPHLYDGLAQWQESGRDQAHAQLGIGLMAVTCEMAWNQGDDLYGYADNRFMYAAEYTARYNNSHDNLPFELYEWGTGGKGEYQSNSVISNASRGEMRPIWAIIYNHYHSRMGYDIPNIEERMLLAQPEGGPGGHGSTFDQLGFGTLLYTRPEGSGTTAQPLSGNIEEGIYKISVRHSGKYLTADSDGVTQKSDGAEGQEWIIADIGGGQYTITNVDSNLTLQIENGSHDPSAAAVVGEYENEAWQKFAFIPADDGYYRITATHASKALDVASASTDDGAKIAQYRYLTAGNQQWKLELVKSEDTTPPENVSADKIGVSVNGEKVSFDVEPVIKNDRTMVPLRAVFEKMGAEVTWNDEAKSAVCTLGENTVTITVGSADADVNGEIYSLDSPAEITDGRILVPLRFIAEGLGATVTWRSESKRAEILIG